METTPKNPFDLYKLLPGSNCRRCMLPSCMAFAVAVVQGQKNLGDCPFTEAVSSGLTVNSQKNPRDENREDVLRGLQLELAQIDLQARAGIIGAPFRNNSVAVHCLGKDFWIDQHGGMSSECHKNIWVLIPALHYVLYSKGVEPAGQWSSFGELKTAGDWSQFFCHRCEVEMQKLADAHTELFFEILQLFGAQEMLEGTNADRSLIIYPLPKLPLRLSYWAPEDGFNSQLTILFDSTATDNCGAEAIYLLVRGIIEMFRELIVRHSKDGKLF